MDNIYFIHDAGSGKLIIKRVKSRGDDEDAVMRLAEREDMRWGDCAWGGVSSINLNI